MNSLQARKETIVIIEHNIEFIARMADYIIDFGVHGGDNGGRIMVQGEPRDVFNNIRSSLHGFSN